MSERITSSVATLFRVENPSHPQAREPDNIVSHESLVGQWFTPDVDHALRFLRKSTQTTGRKAGPIDGTQLVIAHVPKSELANFHVSKHPIGKSMDVENDNYLVPRDGSIETDIIPLDEVLNELRGELGNLDKLNKAKARIHKLLGQVATVAQ